MATQTTAGNTYVFTNDSTNNTLTSGNQDVAVRFYTGTSRQIRTDGGQQTGGRTCNESLKYDNAQKAAFHGMKSAYRMSTDGGKGIGNPQPYVALRIAGNVAKAYLVDKSVDYVPEKSEKHLAEKIKDRVLGGDETDEVKKAIEKAWNKIDGGNHKGGCRVAIAAAVEYLDDFEAP